MVMNAAAIVKALRGGRKASIYAAIELMGLRNKAGTRARVTAEEAQAVMGRGKSTKTALQAGEQGVKQIGRMRYRNMGGGWTRVTVRDVMNNSEVTFSIRTKRMNEILSSNRRFWDPAAEAYSEWIKTTKAGYLYSNRRRVEGLLKAAMKRGDMELAAQLKEILEKPDEVVAKFYDDWYEAHTKTEIAQYYAYPRTTETEVSGRDFDA